MAKSSYYQAVSVMALLAGMSGGAHARTATDSQVKGRPTGLAEVVVTAQRRAELLKNVPITVTALSAKQLVQAGVTSILDLNATVPGVEVGNAVGFVTPHIRGVGSTTIGPGIETDVAIYVDGVYYASSSSALFDFVDVANVEVLKGPQGTLFGRNATGGLIQVTTKDPTQQRHVDVDLTYGNYNTAKADLYLSGGLTDNLTANLAIQGGAMGQGYGKDTATGKYVGQDYGNIAARSKIVYTPSAQTKVTLELDISRQRNSLFSQRIPMGDVHAANLPVPQNTGNAWSNPSNEMPLFDNKDGGFSLKLDQNLGWAHLSDQAAYRQSATKLNFDLDYTSLPEEGAFLHTDENSFSNELQLASNPDSLIKWQTGVFYFQSDSLYDPTKIEFSPSLAGTPFDYLLVNSAQTVDSVAGFGQATAKITDNTNITGGFRYSYEHHNFSGNTTFHFVPPAVPVATFIPSPSPTETKTFESPTYRLAIDHHFTKDTMVYASYNTGFKSGGFNSQTPGSPYFLPEKLIAYEVGTKDSFFDNRLHVGLSGFYYNYTNIQVQAVGLATTNIVNGAAARDEGADLDFSALLTPNFTISGSAEYLNAYFLSFPGAPTGPPIGQTGPDIGGNAAGHRMGYAPPWSETIGGTYTIMAPNDSQVELNTIVEHSSAYYMEADNILRQPDFTKLSASAKWISADDRYAVSLWGHNLTNAAVMDYESTLGVGTRNAHYEPPRTFGITLSYHM